MAEYRITSRGGGLPKAIAAGLYCETFFIELFDYCPEQLLTSQQRSELERFLLHVPPLHARRTKEQRTQAHELLSLIAPLSEQAFVPEARVLLLKRIAGERIRPAHRPPKRVWGFDDDTMLLAKWIKQSVEICIKEGQPLSAPYWGEVREDEAWAELPIGQRSLHIARCALEERGFRLPADPTVRNRMSKIGDLCDLIVKAREEKQG